jgi:DNA gyrase subunit B
VYCYSEIDRDEALKSMSGRINVQRYKGLGEMNAEQLWDTTMNPEDRHMLKVELSDAEDIFATLMGNDVPQRRRFIMNHARSVRNLDI